MSKLYKCGSSDLVVTETIVGRPGKAIAYIVQGPKYYHGLGTRAGARHAAKRYNAFGYWRLKRASKDR